MKHFIFMVFVLVTAASSYAGLLFPGFGTGYEATITPVTVEPSITTVAVDLIALNDLMPGELAGIEFTTPSLLNTSPWGDYIYDPIGCVSTWETMDLTGIFFNFVLLIPTADSGGPYTVGPDLPSMFNHLGSNIPEGYEFKSVQWNVGGTSFSCDYDIEIPIPYEILTDDLGLTNGIYDLKLELTLYHSEDDSDITVIDLTTLEIVPEPCSLLIFGAGSLLVGLRRRGK